MANRLALVSRCEMSTAGVSGSERLLSALGRAATRVTSRVKRMTRSKDRSLNIISRNGADVPRTPAYLYHGWLAYYMKISPQITNRIRNSDKLNEKLPHSDFFGVCCIAEYGIRVRTFRRPIGSVLTVQSQEQTRDKYQFAMYLVLSLASPRFWTVPHNP